MQAQHDAVAALTETLTNDKKDLKDTVRGLWIVLTTKVFFYISHSLDAAGEN